MVKEKIFSPITLIKLKSISVVINSKTNMMIRAGNNLKLQHFLFIMFLLLLQACSTPLLQDSFRSKRLISSKGEKIYVNSINWGVTGDYQLSLISKDSLRLNNRNDTIGSVPGLNPFIYQFKNDTLTLYFYKHISYRLTDDLNTIKVVYKVVSASEYTNLSEKMGCFTVPIL